MLAALDGTEVRAPRLIAACADEDVMGGAVFYLMESVQGFNPTTILPGPHAGDPALRHRMGLEAADALAELGAVDHVAVGLGDFGTAGGVPRTAGRPVAGASSSPTARSTAIRGRRSRASTAVASWLEANRPRGWRPGIMHGDYHLANLLYSFDGPRGRGHRRLGDVHHRRPAARPRLAASRPGRARRPPSSPGRIGAAGGLPTAEELVAALRRALATATCPRSTWYAVLACFKLGIVLEGTHARAFAGKARQGRR